MHLSTNVGLGIIFMLQLRATHSCFRCLSSLVEKKWTTRLKSCHLYKILFFISISASYFSKSCPIFARIFNFCRGSEMSFKDFDWRPNVCILEGYQYGCIDLFVLVSLKAFMVCLVTVFVQYVCSLVWHTWQCGCIKSVKQFRKLKWRIVKVWK